MSRFALMMASLLILGFALASVSGCLTTSVIIVPAGDPIQIVEPVKAKVRINGVVGEATIPAGWWALPDPGD